VAIATLERPLVSCIFSGKRLLCASCPTDELLSAAGCLVPPQLPSSTAHAHMPHTMLHPMRPSSMPPPSGGSRTSLRAAPLELPHVNSIAASLRHTAPLPECDVHSTGLDAAAMHAGPYVVLPRQHSVPERLPKARSTLLELLRHLLRSGVARPWLLGSGVPSLKASRIWRYGKIRHLLYTLFSHTPDLTTTRCT
jgi:hypothetical protein